MKKLAICFMLFCGCVDGSLSNNDDKNICSDNACVDNVIILENGTILSPIDTSKTDRDSYGNEISSNTVLIRFKDGVDAKKAIAKTGGKISAFVLEINVYELRFDFDSAEEVESRISELKNHDEVDVVEKNTVFELEGLDIEVRDENAISEKSWTGVWGLHEIKLIEAYDYIRDHELDFKPVKIAILDSGLISGHFDFDRDIIVDDYDFAETKDSVETEEAHGLAVMGIISAENRDGKGINGIVPHAHILDYKISWSGDKKTFTRVLLTAIEAAISNGADVINISAGTYGHIDAGSSRLLQNIINDSTALLVTSAGNGNSEPICPSQSQVDDGAYKPGMCEIGDDASDHYPSVFQGAISVGALNGLDERAVFSNYSTQDSLDELTLAAPGQNVLVLADDNLYALADGTSFAAPFVTGLAALLKSIDPDLTPEKLRKIMIDTATKIRVTYPGVIETEHTWNKINALESVKMAEARLKVVENIGKPCEENSECPTGSFCERNVKQCVVHCYSEDEIYDAPSICSSCDDMWTCPGKTLCVEWISSVIEYEDNSMGKKICLPRCDSDDDCAGEYICWDRNNEEAGVCIPSLEAFWPDYSEIKCGNMMTDFESMPCPPDKRCKITRDVINLGVCEKIPCTPFEDDCPDNLFCEPIPYTDSSGQDHCGYCVNRDTLKSVGDECSLPLDCPAGSICAGSIDINEYVCEEFCRVDDPHCFESFHCRRLQDTCEEYSVGVCTLN